VNKEKVLQEQANLLTLLVWSDTVLDKTIVRGQKGVSTRLPPGMPIIQFGHLTVGDGLQGALPQQSAHNFF